MDSEIDYSTFSPLFRGAFEPLVSDKPIQKTLQSPFIDLNDLGFEFPSIYEETVQDIQSISDFEADLTDLNDIIKEVTSEIPTSSFDILIDLEDILREVTPEISAVEDDIQLEEFTIEINDFIKEMSSEIPVTRAEAYEITSDLHDLPDDFPALDNIISDVFSPINNENTPEECYKIKKQQQPRKRLGSNKDAVVKYRSKKQKKKEVLFKECEEYSKKNVELKNKIQDIQTEISLIKTLLVEALIAKK